MMKEFTSTFAVPKLSLVEKAFLRERLQQTLVHRAEPAAYWSEGAEDCAEDRAAYAAYLAEFEADCEAIAAAYPDLSFLEPKCLLSYWDSFCGAVYCSGRMNPYALNSFRFYLLGHLAEVRAFEAPYCALGVRFWSWLCEAMPLQEALAKLPYAEPLKTGDHDDGHHIDSCSIFVDTQEKVPPSAPVKKGFARILSFLVGM